MPRAAALFTLPLVGRVARGRILWTSPRTDVGEATAGGVGGRSCAHSVDPHPDATRTPVLRMLRKMSPRVASTLPTRGRVGTRGSGTARYRGKRADYSAKQRPFRRNA